MNALDRYPGPGSSHLKGPTMTAANSIYTSLYDQRVQLVADALERHSRLDEKTAAELAVHVVHAIDHIPEKVR
jgi:hypothetical protein